MISPTYYFLVAVSPKNKKEIQADLEKDLG